MRAEAPLLLLVTTITCLATAAAQQASGLDPEVLQRMDQAVAKALAAKKLPGGVLWLERGTDSYHKAYGKRSLVPAKEAMSEDTIFDAASLTKVVATTPSVMKLVEGGKLRLDDKVQKWVPLLVGDANKPRVTVRHLLTHSSGLPPGIRRGFEWDGRANGLALACAEPSFGEAGRAYAYSDINFILLGEIVERASGQPLQQFAKSAVFDPLQMAQTAFLPRSELLARIAPTTRMEDGSVLRGAVHDPTARAMGGVAGHAGLFTTAADLARYARMLLNEGELDGARVLRAETVQMMTGVQSPRYITARRGFGWDIDSPYAGPRGELFPIGSFGHTGWTGTSLWVDPFSRSFVMFLSNRNHPTERGSVLDLRYRLGTLAAGSISDFDFANVRGALPELSDAQRREWRAQLLRRRGRVGNGIDVLVGQKFAPLAGLKIGLITNHTGRARDGKTSIDLLHDADNVQLVKLFSPEHGIRGNVEAKIDDSIDRKTGLKIHSLYGSSRKPSAAQLEGLEALVFDIQDIGCRFYTYISTMGNCMEAAEAAGLKFFVLDRVNPIGGERVEGPLLAGKRTFTGHHEIPVRHGMTVGEMAKLFKAERYPKLDLSVVKVEGWKRGQLFDDTGLPWVNPSPNIRNLAAAIVYPGVGLLEFTNLSVGRGTKLPFELVGAPYIDPDAFTAELKAARLPGLDFVPARFTPEASKFAGEQCGGVRILLKDRGAATVDLGIAMGLALHKLYPRGWQTAELGKLLVHPPTEKAILAGKPLAEIRAGWQADLRAFAKRRAAVLLY